ncbi:MAG: YopX family protein [Candidatus Cloacimonetes bacterium]|nr:YopX family protein [Candidatus Cloacimonadota bacterium]
MNNYKFRGLTTKGEWIYGSLVVTTNWLKQLPKQHTKTWIIESSFGNGGWFNIMRKEYVRPETVGQFTGFFDNNGKEIYRKDMFNTGAIVEWVKDGWFAVMGDYEVRLSDYLKNDRDRYISGNIHENIN